MSRRLGLSNYHLFWRGHVQTFADEQAGLRSLGEFEDDPSAMASLRALLAESSLEIPNDNLTDPLVLAEIASLLASGELMVVRHWPAHGGSATPPDAPKPSDAPPAPSQGPSGKPQNPESPSLAPDTDAAAQAAVMALAAANGAPLCATCRANDTAAA